MTAQPKLNTAQKPPTRSCIPPWLPRTQGRDKTDENPVVPSRGTRDRPAAQAGPAHPSSHSLPQIAASEPWRQLRRPGYPEPKFPLPCCFLQHPFFPGIFQGVRQSLSQENLAISSLWESKTALQAPKKSRVMRVFCC